MWQYSFSKRNMIYESSFVEYINKVGSKWICLYIWIIISKKSEAEAGKENLVEISLIFKIAAVGILVSILCQILKHSGRDEQAFLVSLAGLLMVLFWIVPYIYELFESIQQLFVL